MRSGRPSRACGRPGRVGPAPLPVTQCLVGLLFLTDCFWDNGHLYRADQPSPAPGVRCLNWLQAQSGLASAPEWGECPPGVAGGRRRAAGAVWVLAPSHGAFSTLPDAGNHSYCRNPDQDPLGPWCYVSGNAGAPEKRPCEDLRCPGTRPDSEDLGTPGTPETPTPWKAWERPLHPPRTCVRASPAGPAPPPRRPIGQGCLQASGPKAHWPLPPLGVSSSSASAL